MKLTKRKAKPPTQQRKITEITKSIAKKKRVRLFFVLFFVICVALYFFIGDRGTYNLIKLYLLKEDYKEQIEKLKTEKNDLEKIESKLENDPQYIEKVAREKYKMKKKGERVYQVVEK